MKQVQYPQLSEARSQTITVAIGGSYGGILSSLLRIHYPSLFPIAFSSSAPWLLLMGLSPNPAQYFSIVTQAFNDSQPECVSIVRQAYTEMFDNYINNSDGKIFEFSR